MLEAQGYVYDGVRRLSYGFASPNFAGAVIALALPVFWALQAYGEKRWHRGWLMLAWLTEYAVFFMVCRTFSRGALVALALAFVHHLAVRWIVARPAWRVEAWAWLTRPAVYAYLAYLASVGGRMRAAFTGTDASALNRLEYWRAGLSALKEIPFFGVSEKQAGDYLTNWIIDIDSARFVGGFVNSFLDWGVAYGLPGLGALVFATTWLALYPIVLKSDLPEGRRLCACGLSTAVVLFAGAACFSSLIGPSFGVNVIAAVLSGANLVLALRWCRTRAGFLAGVVAFALLVTVGARFAPSANSGGCVANLDRTETVRLRRAGSPRAPVADQVVLVCDREVMGSAYGKEARRFLLRILPHGNLLVVPPEAAGDLEEGGRKALIFGARWRSPRWRAWRDMEIVLFHPLGFPDEEVGRASIREIVLPLIDEEGSVADWLEFASARGIPVRRTAGGHRLIEGWTTVFAQQDRPAIGASRQ